MSRPASRVLAMLELLQAHPQLGGRDLADRLGVDERTVRRYAATLVELGIPVTARRGRYGGYHLRPGFRLPPLMFTDDEALAMLLGLVVAHRLGLTAAAPESAAAYAKVQRVLPTVLAQRLTAAVDALGLAAGSLDGAAPAGTSALTTLTAATREHRTVELAYRSWRGESSTRRLDPYGLVFHAGRWYVTGWDHHSDEVRSLRLDRISTLRVGDATFTPPAGFDPVAQVTRSLREVSDPYRVEVLLETDLADARGRIPAGIGELAEVSRADASRDGAGPASNGSDGGVLLRCRTAQLDTVAQLLAGLPCSFTIRAPDELRAALAQHAARLGAFAARGPAYDPY